MPLGKEAIPGTTGGRFGSLLLRMLVLLGAGALFLFLGRSWAVAGRAGSLGLILTLGVTSAYIAVQVVGTWLLYLRAWRRPLSPPLSAAFSVDVFVTACGEPHDLVEAALAAACGLRGAHRTWLLDDGADPLLARLAQEGGAGYLSRAVRNDAKAGNVNAALPRTRGDVIAIFDVDHVPQPDFLERTVGYFADPLIGFVQVMVTFDNVEQSWIAQAAAETSLDFYNPTSLGMDALHSVTMMGSNALIRRDALLSIGGYRPGLAEDLATSIALHAAGWRSAYVAHPLAPGLAPSSIASWFTQQLKWARGVFEVLLADYPRLFRRLSGPQRLCYAVRMTKYWIGPVVFVHLLLTLQVLLSRPEPRPRRRARGLPAVAAAGRAF